MPGAQVSVVVADRQPLFLDAVARAVRQDAACRVVAEVTDGRAALERMRSLQPDVALLGVPLPVLDGARIARAAARDGLPTRVALLMGELDAGEAFDALAGGAAACLSRAVAPETLRRAIAAVARGESVVAEELQTGVAREIRLRHRGAGPLLTAREREVLAQVADGRGAVEIGHRLHLAPTTVKTHLAHAYEKLEVSDRAAAVAAAMRRGLLE